MHVTRWDFSLELPTVIDIRKALDTFLRASKHGKWTQDSTAESDAFLRYHRGSWKESASGLTPARNRIRRRREAPLQLDLEIQPSPKGSRLAIACSFCWHKPVSEKHEEALKEYVASEVRALADHFKGFYGLEAPPTIVAT
jgi:hypothetical protein